MKQLIKGLSTSLLLGTVSLTAVQAEGNIYCGIVNTEKTPLNIRAGMSLDAKVIATASKGSALAYSEAQAGWYKVTLDDGKTGYTRNEFIIDPIGEIRCVKVQINKVNDTTLNVREGMGAGTKVIGKVGEGAMLRLLDKEGEKGEWVRVQISNGKMGYVRKGFVRIYSNSEMTQQAASTNKVTPPKGWRFPTQADYKDDWVAFRKELPVPFHVRGDFNGDQKTDDAWMLLRKDNRGWGLFVFLAQPGGPHQIIKVEENDMDLSPQSMGIELVEPGQYETACGKGYSDCGPGEPPLLNLKFDAIDYLRFESASSIVYWNEKKRQFVKIAISD